MKVLVLGTGTSTGVPVPCCTCATCTSNNPKNKRLRTSIYLSFGAAFEHGVLIDTSTDLRQQALRYELPSVGAVLFTHTHADHVFGIDDLRCFNFAQRSVIPVYASEQSACELRTKFSYCFDTPDRYEGGAPPKLLLQELKPYQVLRLGTVDILPLPVFHGRTEVFGFRMGNFAYITDCSFIPEQTREHLHGLEVLLLDGLRERPHKTHFTLEQAVAEIELIRPERTYLTHISHELDHDAGNERLRELTTLPVELAYDGLEFEVPSFSPEHASKPNIT
ncbi:MAG: MBL fold metallo-hydrolase [Bdellovibrionales bacterium]|nr:MBL fold metallo-hydrolase [Bdellovibrionales bacterium]